MGVYVNNKLIYTVNGTKLNTEITLAPGAEHTVVEEWDYCGGAAYTTIDLTVEASAEPTVSITAKSTTITDGSSTTLTVKATNSKTVTVTGSNGATYKLAASGGTQVVSPTQTTCGRSEFGRRICVDRGRFRG